MLLERGIGEHGFDIADIGHPDHGGTAEFGIVRGQEDPARAFDDGPGHRDLPVIEIQHVAFLVDAGDADDAVIHPEFPDEILRAGADDTVPPATTTSKLGLRAMMEATLRLLVSTLRLLCPSRA